MKPMNHIACACCVFLLLANTINAAEPPATAPADEQAVYLQRFASLKNGQMTVYSPLEVASGKASPNPLPVAKAPTIPIDALDTAEGYARAAKSTAFLVWRNGVVERETYFGGTRADTPLVSKSLSKPLGAVLIGRAIQLGYLRSLDQPVSELVPEWRSTPKASILVRHLLDMRTGLLPQGAAPTAEHILNRAYLSPQHDAVLVAEYPIVNKPGERFDYSNANAELVAVVLERATGMRFAKFLSEFLLVPIGAADVSVWLNRPAGLAHAGCCMLTPAATWLRLGILLINDGMWDGQRLLPNGFVAEMRKGTAQNPHYGLGIYLSEPYTPRRAFGALDLPGPRILQSEPYAAGDLFMFDGNSNQVVYIVPSKRLVLVRLGDTPPAQPEWDNVFLPNLLLRRISASPGS